MKRVSAWLMAHPVVVQGAVGLGVWLLFFWRFITPDAADRVVFPDGDFTQQFYIFRDIAYRQLASGQLPLWANCFFGGYPFHADPQSQLFYLPVWVSFGLLRLMGYGHFPLMALTLEVLAHYLLVGVFVYMWLRDEVEAESAWAGWAALVGALLFTFGGYLTGYPPLQTGILETVTWLPLALWALGRLARTGSRRWLAVASGVLAVAFFAGHPQSFLLGVYVTGAYFVFQARMAGWGWGWLVGYGAGVYGLVGLIAGIQILPQAQFLLLSTRAGLGYDALAGGFTPDAVMQVFVTELVSRWQPLYLTLLGLTLAVLAVGYVRRGVVWFWLAVGLAGLVLSFGGNGAGYPLAYWLLPGFSLFRGQERAALWWALAGAALAAQGVVWLLNTPADDERLVVARNWLRNVSPLAVVLLIGSIFAAQSGLGDWGHLPPRFGLLLVGVALSVIALGVAKWRVAVLLAVVVVELVGANARTNQTAPFETYGYTPLLDWMQVDSATGRWFRVQDDARMQGHWACGYGLAEWGGISPIRLASWQAFEQSAPEMVRWQLLGIDYVISWREELYTREGVFVPSEVVYAGGAPGGEARVHFLGPNARRVWRVDEVVQVDADEVFAALGAARFDGYATAVVTQPLPFGVGRAGSVQVVAERPGRLVLDVALESPGLVVVSEAYYPGWRVDVSGAVVLPVDGYLIGLALPAGRYTAMVEYAPPVLGIGAGVSVVGLLLLAGVGLWKEQ